VIAAGSVIALEALSGGRCAGIDEPGPITGPVSGNAQYLLLRLSVRF
jgi:hypothetical protein